MAELESGPGDGSHRQDRQHPTPIRGNASLAETDRLAVPALLPDGGNLGAALQYAKDGWYVLPVLRGTKHPGSVVGDGWQQKSTRDPELIVAQWAGTDHGIALHAGRSGAVLIDMDHPDRCPGDVLDALRQSWAPFQSSRDNADGRGHYVFRMPSGRCLGNSVGPFQDCGFEVRGHNGVIIVAPSEHENASDGGRYVWEMTGAVPVLPGLIADQLPEASEATEAATDVQVKSFLDAHTAESRPNIVHGHVRAFQKRMGELGSRHTAMVSPLTGAMKEAAAGYYSARRAVEALRDPFITAKTAPFNGRPAMTERAAAEAFKGILSWAIGQASHADTQETHRRVAKEMPCQQVSGPSASKLFLGKGTSPAADETASDTEPNPWGILPGDRFILDQPKNIPAIWGTGNRVLWAEGEGFMIAGTQGLGKTGIAGQLVRELLGLGTGTLFGLPVCGSGEVILYLAMDRPRQIARSMGRQFDAEEREALHNSLIIRPGPPPADLAKQPDLLVRMAADLGARIVFIDSLKDAALGLSDDEVGASYNRARQLLLADGRELCDLHHTVKRNQAGGPPSGIADIYGSTWLTSGCGSVVLLTGDPGDPIIRLRHVKQPADEVGPFTLLADPRTGMFTVQAETDLVALADRGDGDQAEGVTARQAAAILFDTDKPGTAQVEKARRKLDELVDLGQLFRRDGSRGGASGAGAARWFPTGRGA
jgi:hypothetical protein